ncbi:MAG TPA: hypothetical protein VMT16_10780, partial [Thermoanaerobaculia bacterium]|nr:hypothetical protein [Thermoanaerobaculia bacterium]
MNHLSSAHLATRAAAVAALLAILIPGGAQASLTGTGEFKISVQTSGVATEPQVAMDDDGDSVVVWAADEAGASWGIFARRYDRDGLPQGAVIHVNITTAGLQIRPDVAVDADGDFVVVWQSRDQDGDGDGVYARVFDRLGNPLSGEILVNSHTAGNQTDPRVAVDGDGDFVVAWEGRGPIGMSPDVWVRRFSASGVPQGVEVRAPSSMSFHAGNPDVAMDPGGDFVVVFTRAAGGGGSDVFARRFSPFAAQGAEFTVNTFLQHTQGNPAVAMDDSGDFVVVWESFTQDGSDHGIYGQRFAAGGGKQGAEFQVHTFVEGIQIRPTVAIDADGDFVAAWQSPGPQGESS